MGKPSYFYGERGVFKLVNPRNRRDVVIVAMRRGSVRLLKPPSNLWSLRSGIVAGGTALGSLIAYLTVGLFGSLGANFTLSVFGSFVILLGLVFVVATVEERLFRPYAARVAQDSGIEIHIEQVDYHHFYHPVVASAGGRPLLLTIGGRPGRVRRAVTLADSGVARGQDASVD